MEFKTWNTGLDGYTLSITIYPRHAFEVIIGKRCFLWLIKGEK